MAASEQRAWDRLNELDWSQPPPTGELTAWDELARQCRELAELAERARDVRARITDDKPITTGVLDALRIDHSEVDKAARAVQQAAGNCRRDTYLWLRKRRLTAEEIAEAFGGSTRQAVYKILRGRAHVPTKREPVND